TAAVSVPRAPPDAPASPIGVPSARVMDRLPSSTVLASVPSISVLLDMPLVNETLPDACDTLPAPAVTLHGTLKAPRLPPMRVTVSVTGLPSATLYVVGANWKVPA